VLGTEARLYLDDASALLAAVAAVELAVCVRRDASFCSPPSFRSPAWTCSREWKSESANNFVSLKVNIGFCCLRLSSCHAQRAVGHSDTFMPLYGRGTWIEWQTGLAGSRRARGLRPSV
jgi:hypothetical protein